MRQLEHYNFYEQGTDKGSGVREMAAKIIELLGDNDRIRDEREKARKLREKFGGIGSGSNDFLVEEEEEDLETEPAAEWAVLAAEATTTIIVAADLALIAAAAALAAIVVALAAIVVALAAIVAAEASGPTVRGRSVAAEADAIVTVASIVTEAVAGATMVETLLLVVAEVAAHDTAIKLARVAVMIAMMVVMTTEEARVAA